MTDGFQLLAQVGPLDPSAGDGSPSDAQAQPSGHPLTFSDLQSGLRDYQAGRTRDNAMHSGILVLIGAVALFVVIVTLRHRRKQGGPPDSEAKLARELCGAARVGWLDRRLLGWVGRTSGFPVAALMLSSRAYGEAVTAWSDVGTFGPARRWGKSRLRKLEKGLFGG